MLVVAYATGRASHARQVKGDDPDEKGYLGPPVWGLGVRLTTSPCEKKKYCYETSSGGQGPPRAVEPMMMIITMHGPMNVKLHQLLLYRKLNHWHANY